MRFWLYYFITLAVIIIGYIIGIPKDTLIFWCGFITALALVRLLRWCEPC
jgi:hypothetical protein